MNKKLVTGPCAGDPNIARHFFRRVCFKAAHQVMYATRLRRYAMVVILAMGIGLFAPPFGVGYYAACAISRINPDQGMKPIIGYMVALLIGTLIVAAVPWISTGFL
jgi:hypothetical protein